MGWVALLVGIYLKTLGEEGPLLEQEIVQMMVETICSEWTGRLHEDMQKVLGRAAEKWDC